MKKKIIVVGIISLLLVVFMAACRAVEKVPGVSAAQSAVHSVMPTLPGVSPSPAATMTTASTAMTSPMSSTTPSATTR